MNTARRSGVHPLVVLGVVAAIPALLLWALWGWADGRAAIGLARSDDGLVWERASSSPVLEPPAEPSAWDGGGVMTPWVVPLDDGSARMYYVGRALSGARGIGMAASDGADWTRWTRCEAPPAAP